MKEKKYVYIVQDYANVIMAVKRNKKDAIAILREGWFWTRYEIEDD